MQRIAQGVDLAAISELQIAVIPVCIARADLADPGAARPRSVGDAGAGTPAPAAMVDVAQVVGLAAIGKPAEAVVPACVARADAAGEAGATRSSIGNDRAVGNRMVERSMGFKRIGADTELAA